MLTFPCFSFATWRPQLVGQAITGGQATNNLVQTVKTDGGGRWIFTLGDANLNERIKLKAWRAFEAILDGGATEVILMLCDRRQMPGFVSGSAGRTLERIPHSDGALFDDGSGYSQDTPGGTQTTTGAGARRAVTLDLGAVDGIEGGEHFSILHEDAGWRLYRVAQVVGETITFRPPLREAIPAGTLLEFEHPRCVVRLMDLESYAPTVERLRYARGSVQFMESFGYAE